MTFSSTVTMSFQEALSRYLLGSFEGVKEIYNWNFSTEKIPVSYTDISANSYERSRNLRHFIYKSISEKSPLSSDMQIWYVRDWGGVRANSASTLIDYVGASCSELMERGDKGIASWSKMLSVRDPSAYAIYDARVALTLNTISEKYSVFPKILFPQLLSRNKKIVSAQKKVSENSKNFGLQPVENFYRLYLSLLKNSVMQCEYKFDLQAAEMILFANAEIMAEYWSKS